MAYPAGRSVRRLAAPLTALVLLLPACGADEDARTLPEVAEESGTRMTIVARDRTFEAPDTLRPGWTTIELTNMSPMIHFAMVSRLPPGVRLEDHQRDVAPVFQQGLDLMVQGDTETAMQRLAELPEWTGEVVLHGGPGLTSPGLTSEATVYLETGTYLIECYVKTDGVLHAYNPEPNAFGMVHELVVAGPAEDTREPEPSLRLTISSVDGITMEGDPMAGEHVVAVHFADQMPHENLAGHDVHVARLAPGADLDALAAWMDWTREGGLEDPAPVTFLGGTQGMPGGATAYFTVELTPGDYAWIAEVPQVRDKGMLVPFTVPGAAPGS